MKTVLLMFAMCHSQTAQFYRYQMCEQGSVYSAQSDLPTTRFADSAQFYLTSSPLTYSLANNSHGDDHDRPKINLVPEPSTLLLAIFGILFLKRIK